MLRGGNPLTVGVGIIIEVIRKNNSDYDPDVGAGQNAVPSSSDPIYLGTLLRLFAKHVPDFMELILSPNHTVPDGDGTMTIKRKELPVAFGGKVEPLGFDRFKTCELMAELLHCSNMGLLNERGSEAFVKQRDQEREKLKALGSLSHNREPRSAVTEFSEDSTAYQNGTSPEIRKLEVANSADEDGFEDVGASADLVQEIKDDFDEKSPFELEASPSQATSQTGQAASRLDMDDDFVDEPLTSPRLEAFDEKKTEIQNKPELDDGSHPQSSSPTKALTAGIEDLQLGNNNDDTPADSDTSSIAILTPDTLNEEIDSQITSKIANSDAPPLPHRDRNLNVTASTPERGLSPHPDDKPPPLFAGKSDETPSSNELHQPEHETDRGSSLDTIDTTMGEEGDSARSMLAAGNEQSFAPQIESDVDGQPIVGDFLKMRFVEHKVVPTILVGTFTNTSLQD